MKGARIMIIKQTVKEFENLGFGMFIHFGLYSLLEQGEWTLFTHKLDPKRYESLAKDFAPKIGWARNIAACAKNAGKNISPSRPATTRAFRCMIPAD